MKRINYINSLCLISLIAMAALFDLVTPLNLIVKARLQPQTESDFVGTFTGTAGDGRLDEEWTITNAGGRWDVVGNFYWKSGEQQGQVAGGFRSENVRMEGGVLKFKQVFTKKPFAFWADSSNMEATVAGDTLTFKNQYVSGIKLKRKGAERSASPSGEPKRESKPRSNDCEVLEIVGEVELSPGGDDSQAYPITGGETVNEADRIFTSMNSYAVLRFRSTGNIVRIGPVTDLKIGAFRDEGTFVQTQILLRGGEVSCEVNKRTERPSDFAVKTPTATCGVRSTKFTVRHDDLTKTTTISVTEGEVKVTPENTSLQALSLSADQRVQVSANHAGPITNVTSSHDATTPQATAQPSPNATVQPSAAEEKGGVSVIAVVVTILVIAGALILILRSRGRAA